MSLTKKQNETNKINMQQKAINFGNFISTLGEKYLPEGEDQAIFCQFFSNYFTEESKYLDFMFVYVAGLCNFENSRSTVEKVRELALVDDNETFEKKLLILEKWRRIILLLNQLTEKLKNETDAEFEKILTKFCQYVHLFTYPYFKK